MNDWNVGFPDDITKHRGDITVACTNWDMACRTENYGDGCKSITYNGQEFLSHRWQKNYRHSKKAIKAMTNFWLAICYFEIDWFLELPIKHKKRKMVFSSILFLLYFLPAFMLLYFFADPKYKNYLIVAGSIFFYM
ncbi:MAG: hypothetical protein IPP29_05020 [Bacteroidetes bacterium]|nr:hypothetical protein [Bacteroidota bacterium]